MKPYAFELRIPRSLDEVITILTDHGDEAKLLAGGQSLVPMMNLRMAAPELLVDLNRVDGLDHVSTDEHGNLRIGAMTRHRTLERDLTLRPWRLFDDAVPAIGHVGIRNRGTIGGSLAHADPAAELPAVCVAMGASLQVRGPAGTRAIDAGDFFEMVFTTALEPDEVLVEVVVPPVPPGTGEAWVEFARRHGDFALIGVAARVSLDDDTCTHASLTLAGAASVPQRVPGLGELAAGRPADTALFADLAGRAADAASPPDDLHAPADYRRHLIKVLSVRALAIAARRARSAEGTADA